MVHQRDLQLDNLRMSCYSARGGPKRDAAFVSGMLCYSLPLGWNPIVNI